MDEIARLVTAGHRSFLDAARRRDGATARRVWSDYLDITSKLLVDRRRSRRPIDVVPLWRGRAPARAAAPGRLAAAVADEIRARIAEGRLADGDRLPGLPDLAEEFLVSRPTLREALRILEMEFLVDLRAGDRNGPRIRHPSSQVATQLAGTVFQARQTTVEDFFHAVAMIEPAMIELATTRIGPPALERLQTLAAQLTASADDVSELLLVWKSAREVTFSATGNPALVVIAEILQWMRVGIHPTVTAWAAADSAWLAEEHRLAALFTDLVVAFEAGDGARAASVWAQSLNANSPYIESSELGRQLVIDLIGRKEGVPWTSLT